MKLDNIYLTGSILEKLTDKLEEYNEKHPNEQISYQEMCEMGLKYWIKYGSIENID